VLAQRWHNNQVFQDTKTVCFLQVRGMRRRWKHWHVDCKSAARIELKTEEPNMSSIRAHHVIAAFFIAVSALSTGLMALAIALATTGCAL
jgi:hypothetical protein